MPEEDEGGRRIRRRRMTSRMMMRRGRRVGVMELMGGGWMRVRGWWEIGMWMMGWKWWDRDDGREGVRRVGVR